jgi:hypothetical protein
VALQEVQLLKVAVAAEAEAPDRKTLLDMVVLTAAVAAAVVWGTLAVAAVVLVLMAAMVVIQVVPMLWVPGEVLGHIGVPEVKVETEGLPEAPVIGVTHRSRLCIIMEAIGMDMEAQVAPQEMLPEVLVQYYLETQDKLVKEYYEFTSKKNIRQ